MAATVTNTQTVGQAATANVPAADAELVRFANTDAGNAEAFVHLYEDSVRYDHRRKRWLIWSPPLWRPDENREIQRLALAAMRARQVSAALYIQDKKDKKEAVEWALASESSYRCKALLEFAAAMLPISDKGSGWDEDDWLLGCENGVVDLRTGKLRPGRQADRLTLSTGLEFDANAACPRWLQFLDEVFEDRELIDFIWRAVGYSLTGSIVEEVVFFCYGTGANGKSKFIGRLRDILGDYSWNTPFSTFELTDRPGTANNELAVLAGMRAVTASETKESAHLNEARIKSLTGGDDITARFLYAEQFRFRPKLKIWLSVNHKPNVSDDSEGFWRRVRLIPFTKRFAGKQRDKNLEKKLKAEAQGVLAWAVRGCLEWQRRGLEPPASVVDATKQYQQESDEVTEFINLCCVVRPGVRAYANDLYQAYMEYANNVGERPMSANALGRRLAERGFRKERDWSVPNGRIFYAGIGVSTITP